MTKILVAEHNETTSNYIKQALRKSGNLVDIASTSPDAWRATSKTEYDVMIVDVVMPGIDGFVLAQKALQENPTLQIIFITGFAAVAMDTYQTPSYSPAPITSRPFHLSEISSRVRYLMGEADLPSQRFSSDAQRLAQNNVIYPEFGASRQREAVQ